MATQTYCFDSYRWQLVKDRELFSRVAYCREPLDGAKLAHELIGITQLYLAGDLAGIFRLSVEPARRLGPDFAANSIVRLIDDRNRVTGKRCNHGSMRT